MTKRHMPHPDLFHARRHLLGLGLAGLSGVATAPLLAEGLETSPLSLRPAHFPAKAKRVIFLFMLGGPSQLDLFDDKPKLRELDGQPIAEEHLARMKFAQIMEQRPNL